MSYLAKALSKNLALLGPLVTPSHHDSEGLGGQGIGDADGGNLVEEHGGALGGDGASGARCSEGQCR